MITSIYTLKEIKFLEASLKFIDKYIQKEVSTYEMGTDKLDFILKEPERKEVIP